MYRFLVIAIFSSAAFAQSSSVGSQLPASSQLMDQPTPRVETASVGLPDLPPLPRGKSTVIGGSIRAVDEVRDQLTLNIFGARSMKVLFDARTEVYRDGVKASLRDLQAGDHVSVETMLDGSTVFARSIHMLSQLPQGQCEGQVLHFNAGEGELTVSDVLSHAPIKIRVPAGTSIVRQGQAATSADQAGAALTTGTLVSVKFQSDNRGHGVASEISVLATPGSVFIFVGNVAFLDVHAGRLELVDPRDNNRYEISFDPARLPMSHDLREGADVTVTANFDGTRYSAQTIAINPVSGK
jgi:hypothetical protein